MARNRLYDFTQRDHQTVLELMEHVQGECLDRSIDGIIVIIARKNGKKTQVFTAGSLAKHERAASEGFRLQLTMAAERNKGK